MALQRILRLIFNKLFSGALRPLFCLPMIKSIPRGVIFLLIRKMSATFGRLQNQSLELRDGLNVIQAPNETGKSTWCAFLAAMLFGINSRERD